MPGMFIDVQVDANIAADPVLSAKLVEVCPVGIFDRDEGETLRIVEENLDECVLCDLCSRAVPDGGVRVVKLYE